MFFVFQQFVKFLTDFLVWNSYLLSFLVISKIPKVYQQSQNIIIGIEIYKIIVKAAYIDFDVLTRDQFENLSLKRTFGVMIFLVEVGNKVFGSGGLLPVRAELSIFYSHHYRVWIVDRF